MLLHQYGRAYGAVCGSGIAGFRTGSGLAVDLHAGMLQHGNDLLCHGNRRLAIAVRTSYALLALGQTGGGAGGSNARYSDLNMTERSHRDRGNQCLATVNADNTGGGTCSGTGGNHGGNLLEMHVACRGNQRGLGGITAFRGTCIGQNTVIMAVSLLGDHTLLCPDVSNRGDKGITHRIAADTAHMLGIALAVAGRRYDGIGIGMIDKHDEAVNIRGSALGAGMIGGAHRLTGRGGNLIDKLMTLGGNNIRHAGYMDITAIFTYALIVSLFKTCRSGGDRFIGMVSERTQLSTGLDTGREGREVAGGEGYITLTLLFEVGRGDHLHGSVIGNIPNGDIIRILRLFVVRQSDGHGTVELDLVVAFLQVQIIDLTVAQQILERLIVTGNGIAVQLFRGQADILILEAGNNIGIHLNGGFLELNLKVASRGTGKGILLQLGNGIILVTDNDLGSVTAADRAGQLAVNSFRAPHVRGGVDRDLFAVAAKSALVAGIDLDTGTLAGSRGYGNSIAVLRYGIVLYDIILGANSTGGLLGAELDTGLAFDRLQVTDDDPLGIVCRMTLGNNDIRLIFFIAVLASVQNIACALTRNRVDSLRIVMRGNGDGRLRDKNLVTQRTMATLRLTGGLAGSGNSRVGLRNMYRQLGNGGALLNNGRASGTGDAGGSTLTQAGSGSFLRGYDLNVAGRGKNSLTEYGLTYITTLCVTQTALGASGCFAGDVEQNVLFHRDLGLCHDGLAANAAMAALGQTCLGTGSRYSGILHSGAMCREDHNGGVIVDLGHIVFLINGHPRMAGHALEVTLVTVFGTGSGLGLDDLQLAAVVTCRYGGYIAAYTGLALMRSELGHGLTILTEMVMSAVGIAVFRGNIRVLCLGADICQRLLRVAVITLGSLGAVVRAGRVVIGYIIGEAVSGSRHGALMHQNSLAHIAVNTVTQTGGDTCRRDRQVCHRGMLGIQRCGCFQLDLAHTAHKAARLTGYGTGGSDLGNGNIRMRRGIDQNALIGDHRGAGLVSEPYFTVGAGIIAESAVLRAGVRNCGNELTVMRNDRYSLGFAFGTVNTGVGLYAFGTAGGGEGNNTVVVGMTAQGKQFILGRATCLTDIGLQT